MTIKKSIPAISVFLAVILLDQILKIWVKTHFWFGEDYEITSWFHLKYIENNGMAFGLQLWNKLILTFGRILAVAFFIWFIVRVSRSGKVRTGFLICISLIAAGAAGNIVDCVFYGKIFNNPWPPQIAQLFPPDGGYSGWFEGQVVDMLYFPLFSFDIGGKEFEFFQYIFNIADAAICVGVFILILFYSHDLSGAWKIFTSGLSRKKKDNDSNPQLPSHS